MCVCVRVCGIRMVRLLETGAAPFCPAFASAARSQRWQERPSPPRRPGDKKEKENGREKDGNGKEKGKGKTPPKATQRAHFKPSTGLGHRQNRKFPILDSTRCQPLSSRDLSRG